MNKKKETLGYWEWKQSFCKTHAQVEYKQTPSTKLRAPVFGENVLIQTRI